MPKHGRPLNATSRYQQDQRGSFPPSLPVPPPAEDVSPPVEDTANAGRDLGNSKTEEDRSPGRELGM